MNPTTTDTPRTDDHFRDATKMVLDQKPTRIPKQKKCTFCGGSGWWMDAMGTNSYRCDKCQNAEKNDHIVEVNKMVPTPPDFWEEEAKRYCSNSQYWRERAEKAEAEVERLKYLLSDLLILTEKNYWNSHNYNQIKEALTPTTQPSSLYEKNKDPRDH